MTSPLRLSNLARLRGSGVVVAVSGGGDSVGLLRALNQGQSEFALRLSVAHLDHGVRGEEGRGDARFVSELAEGLGLPFDLGHWQPARATHFEADARKARYDWLIGVAASRGSRFVAVGHTLDDQAETVLHRIVRGTGFRGLAGMPGRRRLAPGVELVRPLLEVSRRDIRAYLDAIGQGFREDASNLDTARTRTRIRLELLPELVRSYNPEVARALVRLARIAAEADHTLERLARKRLASVMLESGSDRLVLDRTALQRLGMAARLGLLRVAWQDLGWPEQAMDDQRWRRLARLDFTRISAGAGVDAQMDADRLILSRIVVEETANPDPGSVELPVPGWVSWAGSRVEASLESGDEWVDMDALRLPLQVRRAEPGDRFEPLGLAGRSQPLNDFFRGRRVPGSARGSVPVVCDQEGIIWVAGHRIAHRVRWTEGTRRRLGLRFEPGQEEFPA